MSNIIEFIEAPLSKLSLDKTNNFAVCNYKNKFIDLDETKGLLRRASSPKSPDMLYIDDSKKEIWFVEFKSSTERNLKDIDTKIKLKQKIFAGLFLIYELACEKSCEYRDYKKFYFLVYDKPNSSSFEDELLNIFNEDSQRSIEFGLEDLKKNGFVNNIFTESCNSLKILFEKRFGIEFIPEANYQ